MNQLRMIDDIPDETPWTEARQILAARIRDVRPCASCGRPEDGCSASQGPAEHLGRHGDCCSGCEHR